MTAQARRDDGHRQGSFGWLTGLVAMLVLAGEVAGASLLLRDALGPASIATVAGTAAVAAVLGGSFLLVLVRQAGTQRAVGEKSALVRVAELTVAITVLTLVTAIAAVCGLVLTLVATLGGPDPHTADGDRLRDRLLGWMDRNRAFIRRNGRGELPLGP